MLGQTIASLLTATHLQNARSLVRRDAGNWADDGNWDDNGNWRGGGGGNMHKLPGWSLFIMLANLVVFLPMFLYVFYTLWEVYPTLAMVEDEMPPEYDPVPLGDDDVDALAADDDMPAVAAVPTNKPNASRQAVTSSLRAINRLLWATGGWRASLRGILAAFLVSTAQAFVVGFFTVLLPTSLSVFGSLLAHLAVCSLSAAWVHIVMTSSRRTSAVLLHRLPPFRRTFEATCFPILAVWVATALATAMPLIVGALLGLPLTWPIDLSVPGDADTLPSPGAAAWKSLIVLVAALTAQVFIVVPARVVLVRVQASLLPADEHTIVPFDRSFGGRVEPEVVTGKGYATMRDALATFGRPQWVRLYKLYAKVLAVTVACYGILVAVLVPEVLLMMSAAK